MGTVPRRLWALGTALFAVTAFMASLNGQAVASCTCKEVPYLLKMLAIDQRALDTIQVLKASTKPVDVPAFLDSIRQTRNSVSGAANAMCSTYLDPANPSGNNIPAQLAQLEAFYTSSRDRSLKSLSTVPKSCLPEDWIGTINVSATDKMTANIDVPAIKTDGDVDRGGQETGSINVTVNGSIWINESGDAASTWEVARDYRHTTMHKSMIRCTSDRTKAPFENTAGSHDETTTTGSKSLTGEIALTISDDGKTGEVSFTIPAIPLSGEASSAQFGSAPCPGDLPARNVTAPVTEESEQMVVAFSGPLSPGKPLQFSGKKTIELPGSTSIVDPNQEVTIKKSVDVSYHLFKLR